MRKDREENNALTPVGASERLYSAQEVADLLGLHVKTVRAYVREGRLQAVRIGKQYKIAATDLESFTGRPAPSPARETARRTRRVEVSAIVQIDAIRRDEVIRLSNTLTAALTGHRGGGGAGSGTGAGLRVETAYDEERAALKLILLGDLDGVAELMKIISALTGEG